MVFVGFALERRQLKGISLGLKRQAGRHMKQTNYIVGNFLIILKNAVLAGKKTVRVEKTKMVESVADVLKRLGFISEIKEADGYLEVSLTYKNKSPILTDIKLVSKPGLRVYWDLKKIKDFHSRYVLIISTPKGVMSSKEALKEGLGGEVIAQVL